MPSLRHKRGTRAQIDAAATSDELKAGEVYLITDEDRLTVGTGANSHQPMARQGEGGSGGGSAGRQIIDMGGRWFCYTNHRWVGFLTSYGSRTQNFTQNGGTGAEPNIIWNQLGPFILDGGRVTRLRIAGAADHTTLTGINIRLYHQTGPWDGTWDSVGETIRTPLLSVNNLDFSNADMKRYVFDFDQTVVGDGFLIMFVQPIGPLTTTRGLQSNVSVEWEPA